MYAVQKETGWTDEYLLWKISLANLRMKLADSMRYIDEKEKSDVIDDFDDITFDCE